MDETKIQWTWRCISLPNGKELVVPGYSFNPWIGCVKVAPECHHCYAESMALRWGWDLWGPAANTRRRITGQAYWKKPLKWNREAAAQGHRRSVFCASLADVFEEHPDIIEARTQLWSLIEQTPWLNWLLLTKRPENMRAMTPSSWSTMWPDNVWAGTSAGTQETAQQNIPTLLTIPSCVKFVSCEPQLEYVDFMQWLPSLQWVICGGESGTKARPLDLDWTRSLRDQCQEHHTAFFFKQVGGLYHNSRGRVLDGRTWDEVPPEVPV